MTDFTSARSGQVNSAGDALALFLKVFGGEVMTAFNNKTVFMDKHRVRNIQHGKSAQFPATGKASGGYHTPGTTLVGQAINHNERVITVDDLLVADTFIPSIDEAMNHYDVRGPYAEQLSDFLAQTFDLNVARNMVLAARASATVTGLSGGSQLTGITDVKTNAATLASALFTCAQTFDEKFVADGNRTAFVKPAQFYLAAQSTNLINKDWGGSGSLASGTIESLAGINIVKTNNIPQADDSANTDLPAKYRASYLATAAIVTTPDACGTVKLMDMAVESEWQIREQGYFTLAKYLLGHGILRPECAIEITTSV